MFIPSRRRDTAGQEPSTERGKPTINQKEIRYENEIPFAESQEAEFRDFGLLGRKPKHFQRGNFSIYPTLSVPSQEFFVNSRFEGPV